MAGSLEAAKFKNILSIGYGAFSSQPQLTSIYVPNTRYIAAGAFCYCTNLSILDLSETDDATILSGRYGSHFYGCPHPVSVFVKNDEIVEKFSDDSNWSKLLSSNQVVFVAIEPGPLRRKKIIMTDVYGSQHEYSANDPSILSTMQYVIWDDEQEQNVVTEPYSSNETLSDMHNLFSVQDSGQLTAIEECSFDGCDALVSVDFPGVTDIYYGAFYGCVALSSVNVSNAMNLDEGIFHSCESLLSIHLNSTTIPADSFSECISLECGYFPHATDIGADAFCDCYSLISVHAPEISAIGNYSFEYCESLISCDFPKCVAVEYDAFDSCINLQQVNLSSTLSIGEYAFYDCSSLMSVNLCSLIEYGDALFSGCHSLSSIYVDNEVLHSIGNGYEDGNWIVVNDDETELIAVAGATTHLKNDTITYAIYACCEDTMVEDIELPNIKAIEGWAFNYNQHLKTVKCEKVESIDSGAFSQCHSLSSIYVDNEVLHSIGNGYEDGNWIVVNDDETELIAVAGAITHISNDTILSLESHEFQYCENLNSVSLPNVTSIGYEAFWNCYSLSSIYVNNSILHSIGNGYGIDNQLVVNNDVTKIRLAAPTITQVSNNTATSIGSYAFSDCASLSSVSLPNVTSIGNSTFYYCTSLSSIDSLPNVTSIGSYAFSNCSNLSSIDCLSNVTSIGNGAFSDCTSLSSISLPNATSIGSWAFWNCISLNSVSLPNVTSIGSYAFSDCASLSSVNLPNATSIGSQAFIDCRSLSSISFKERGKPRSLSCIHAQAFSNCSNLKEIILATKWDDDDVFVELDSINAFEGLPADYFVTVSHHDYHAKYKDDDVWKQIGDHLHYIPPV